MIALPSSLLILGFARSGQAAATFFKENNVKVYVYDDDKAKKNLALEQGYEWYHEDALLEGVVQSPVIPPSHPLSEKLKSAGITVECDLGWYNKLFPHTKFLGITGTNGKSTSTALLGHILKEAGYDVAIGGNFGIPVFSLPKVSPKGFVVLEISSYQLELCNSLSLELAGWTNISEDHLERHGTLKSYIAAKTHIFDNAKSCIISLDDPFSKRVYEEMLTKGYSVSSSSLREIHPYETFKNLLGVHNHQNAALVYQMAKSLGLPDEIIYDGMRSFKGLEHRLERVGVKGAITFINDSKATNGDATRWALEACDSIFWLVGGADKTDGIDKLLPYSKKIIQTYTFGRSKDRFYNTLLGHCEVSAHQTLNQAFEKAYEDAQNYEKPCTILLSPACASFDQFKDYEHRGMIFKDLVTTVL